MKKFIFAILSICSAVMFTSCAHMVYPMQSLYENYNSRMSSTEELEIKSKVNIYFNENDVKGEFEIISVNTYSPFCFLPFKPILQKKMTKKFLVEAVKKAYEEGGNAILVKSAGYFYVLNLKNWVADDTPAAIYVNPIFNMEKAEAIKSGTLAQARRSERIRMEKAFMDEIETNIDNVKDLEEIAIIRKKIKILSEYNLTRKNSSNTIEKAINKSNRRVNRAEKKITKEIAKKTTNAIKKADNKIDEIGR